MHCSIPALARCSSGRWPVAGGSRSGRAPGSPRSRISTIYGVTDEVHQMFVPLRTADLADLAADALGAAAAVLVLYAAHTIRTRFGRSFPIGDRKR